MRGSAAGLPTTPAESWRNHVAEIRQWTRANVRARAAYGALLNGLDPAEVTRRCPCGEVAYSSRATYCEGCRADARRRSQRNYEQRWKAKA